jgi:flavodoxin
MKRIWKVVLALAALALALAAVVVYKDAAYVPSPPYTPPLEGTDVLVAYYSRTGHTEAMAREIARALGADLVHIEAGDYPPGVGGALRAASDAIGRKPAQTSPAEVDLSRYRLVLLGSPIWFFRPAPPLWSFVERNDLTGKRVVLFNSFNSRFDAEEVALFRAGVERRGGRLVDHLYVRRGRYLWQKSREELLQETRELVRARSESWLGETPSPRTPEGPSP